MPKGQLQSGKRMQPEGEQEVGMKDRKDAKVARA